MLIICLILFFASDYSKKCKANNILFIPFVGSYSHSLPFNKNKVNIFYT